MSRKVYEFGPFRCDAAAGLLFRKGRRNPVHLTPKEAGVLLLLLENAGTLVEKEEFGKRVWPDIHLEIQLDNSLKRAISTLKKSLKQPQYIKTHSGRGYRFAAKVEVIGGRKGKPKLVVLPFQSLGRTRYPQGFLEGLTHDVTTQLGCLNPDELRVIASSTAAKYKKTRKRVSRIGEELEVQYVLAGAVLGSGNKVRVSIQLIHAPDESQLWGKAYERKLDDILVFLREICQDIAREIEIKLVPLERERLDYLPPVNPEAYKSYIAGRNLWNKRTPESLREAISLFEQANKLDSSFARAHSALADSYAVMASQSWVSPKQACDRVKSAASKAMSIDRNFAEPHAALGFVLSVFEHQWVKAEQEFKESLRLNANYATAHHWYSFYFAALDRLPEAIQQIRKAQEIDPLSRIIKTNVGTMLYWARDYEAAIDQYNQVLRLDGHFWYAYWMRGLACDEKGQHRQAVTDQRRALKYFPGQSPLLAASLGRSLALAGDNQGARLQLKAVSRAARDLPLPHYHFALVHAALGDKDAAFRSLFESCAAREMWVSFVQVDPKMNSLRDDSRYAELRRRLALC